MGKIHVLQVVDDKGNVLPAVTRAQWEWWVVSVG